jgi:WD40 repeat protein/serine/threonine protein kinase
VDNTPSASENLAGKTLRGYALQERIGTGGFGEVYRAFQDVIQREVAIKVILPTYANQTDFIRRFESEAQLVARLEHPNIVPLYDYWRDPSGAYLVMRWLRGGNLRNLIGRGKVMPDQASRILDQVAAALSAAHRAGVVHRDIKPDNILLDKDSNAYLADFGIALTGDIDTLSDETGFVGSPSYVSPEQIIGEQLTFKTDIYSLGIVLYEMLAGHRPFQDLSVTTLLRNHLSDPLPELVLEGEEYRGIFPVLQRATAKDPNNRYADALAFAAAFRNAFRAREATLRLPNLELDLTGGESTTVVFADNEATTTEQRAPINNPYKGLRAFQEADAVDFFGRDSLIQTLIGQLMMEEEGNRFLAVVGPSGSGKSSVVKAGLLPMLRVNALPGSGQWLIVEMTPGARPFEELEDALLRIAVNPPLGISSRLRNDGSALYPLVASVLPPETEVLLVIDQFEEIFTLADEATRARFLENITNAITDPNNQHLRIIITLRADFYDRPLLYPQFGDLIRRRTEVVLPLGREEMRQAITNPAQRLGLRLEEGLVDAILADVGEQAGMLPLMQYALTELFEERQGRTLMLSAYREKGGVLGALTRRADQIYETLGETAHWSIRQIFLRLVSLGEGTEDTRRRAGRAELLAISRSPEEIELITQIVDSYGKYRLFTFDNDPISRAPTVTVAHEALIRSWSRLRGWLDASREDIRIQRRLANIVEEWVRSGRETSFLASGARLDQFMDWRRTAQVALSQDEIQYLEASYAEQTARRLRDEKIARRVQNFGRAAAILGVMAFLAVIATLFAISQTREAQDMANMAAQTLTPVPLTLTPIQKTLSAGQAQIEAGRSTLVAISTSVQNQTVQIGSLNFAARADEILRIGGNPETAALLAVAGLRLAYNPQTDAQMMLALDNVYVRQVMPHDQEVSAVAVAPDGSRFATGDNDGFLRIWDMAGKLLLEIKAHDARILALAFTADSKSIYSAADTGPIIGWNAQNGDAEGEFGSIEGAFVMAFSSGATLLASADNIDNIITLWDVQTGEALLRLEPGNATLALAFSLNGRYLLTGGQNGIGHLWDLQSQTRTTPIFDITVDDNILAVDFVPNSNSFVVASGNNAILFDSTNLEIIKTYTGHSDLINSLVVSADGSQLLTTSADGTSHLWDIDTGITLRRFSGHGDSVTLGVFIPTQQMVLTASQDSTARLWDADLAHAQRRFDFAAPVLGLAVSPDGKYIVVSIDDNNQSPAIFDRATGELIYRFQDRLLPPVPLSNVIYTADGSSIYLCARNIPIAVAFQAPNGPLLSFFNITGDMRACALSPDGKIFAVGGTSVLNLWDTATRQSLKTVDTQNARINALAFSPDGRFLAVGYINGNIMMWDINNDSQLWLNQQRNTIWDITFSPDGKRVLTGEDNGLIRTWDAQTGAEVQRFPPHGTQVSAAVYSPDGRYIASGSFDNTAIVWDAITGEPVRFMVGHQGSIDQVAFTPDSTQLITGSQDGTVRIWDVDPAAAIAYACSRLPADLTADQRGQYGLLNGELACPK